MSSFSLLQYANLNSDNLFFLSFSTSGPRHLKKLKTIFIFLDSVSSDPYC